MKQRLLFLTLCLFSTRFLLGQISNTETTITLASSSALPSQVCSWNNIPSSSPSNVYQVYIVYEDGDNFGTNKRLPASGYYNCTVTNTPNAYGPNIFINAPTAAFPTPSNTVLGFSLVDTKGVVYLLNTSTNATTYQIFEYDQYTCPALPIYIAYFRLDPNYYYGSTGVNFLKFDWQAVDEEPYLSHYILQRSYNNFTWIDEVLEPAVTGDGIHNYSVYVNKHASNPYVWFRLKWIGEYGFAKTTQSIRPTGISGAATNIACNYTNITGPASVCAYESGVYKIHNVPASAAPYNWTASGATINGLSQANLTADVSFGSASATLFANSANGSCNKSKAVGVTGGSLYINQDNVYYYSSYTSYYLSVNLLPGTTGSQYSWYNGGVYRGTGASKYFQVYEWCDDIEVRLNTACGQSVGYRTICYYPQPDPCNPNPPSNEVKIQDRFTVGPVPANDNLTISLRLPPCELTPAPARIKGRSSDIYTIQLYDMFGNLRLERRNVSLKNDHQLDVRSVPTGNYILYIKNDLNTISKQVRIAR